MGGLSSSRIRLVIFDIRNTMVHGDPFCGMIKAMLPLQVERHAAAESIVEQAESGKTELKEVVRGLANLCQSGSLKRAVEYATFKMKLVKGFDQFVDAMFRAGIGLAVITPLFGVITATLRNVYGHDRFVEIVSNPLQFALDGNDKAAVTDARLNEMIERFFIKARDHKAFDRMQATGKVFLEMESDTQRAELVGIIARRHGIALEQVAYLASHESEIDTLVQVVSHGAMAIAFNYRQNLVKAVESSDAVSADQVSWTDACSRRANLKRPAALILS